MMKRWLKPKKDSSLQEQLEWEAQKKKEALCFQEFNKRSLRVVTRLRELEKVRDRFIKQFVPEVPDFRHKTAISDYFTDEKALMAYIANSVKHFQSTDLKEESIPRGASWQSSLVEKNFWKKGKSKLSNDDNKYNEEQNS